MREINTALTKTKDPDDRKALELRRTVADNEGDKLPDELNKVESLQNKYDDMLRELPQSAPSAATSASSTKKNHHQRATRTIQTSKMSLIHS